MAKTVDKLFATVQTLYNGILKGIDKFLNSDFKTIFNAVLEAAQIAAEIALAFATGGGSILLQIVKWLATTLPQLFQKAKAVLGFVDTIRNLKLEDAKKLLNPAGIGGFLVKGLFGELNRLPEGEAGEKKEGKEPETGREEKGLMKVFHILSGLFKTLKGTFGKVAGAINKILPAINISNKPWFDPFSMIYAGAVKALEIVKNPAETLNAGVEKLKEAAAGFFKSIKTKLAETAGSIKEKIMLLGQPAKLIKLIANKAVDMVLNFIITHPPSALIKAAFKAVEAASGKSIVELVRQYIPFADKLINKIAESGPVQALMKPLEHPVKTVGGMIDQVSEKAVGMVEDSEQKATTTLGSGAKLLTGLAGVTIGAKAATNKAEGKKGEGGDFLGSIKGGIHTRLLAFGQKLLQSGKALLMKGVDKLKGMLTPKVKFRLGSEEHELWVVKGSTRNIVIMASGEGKDIREHEDVDKQIVEDVKLRKKIEETEKAQRVTVSDVEAIRQGLAADITEIIDTKYLTNIEGKVTGTNRANLPEWIAESFTDGNYRTVITNENITFYRTFGGKADAGGGFATTNPATNRIQAKIDLALLPEWGNTRMYEAVIEVPKGQVLNIGKVAEQYTKTGAKLAGQADQILLPQNWPLEWIKQIRVIPSR